jgi:uncharacterized protein (TIGR00730 family)
MSKPLVVSVYGSARPQPDHPLYIQAEHLGRLLGEAGYTVMTGGYGGVMEAASKGAKQAGAHVIGVTVGLFERSGRRSGPNPYVDEVIRYDTLSERLLHVVTRSDAAIALAGGIGTLSEVALTWSLLQVGEIKPKPFVLLGREWDDLFTLYRSDGMFITEEEMNLWQLALTPEEAVMLIKNWKQRGQGA